MKELTLKQTKKELEIGIGEALKQLNNAAKNGLGSLEDYYKGKFTALPELKYKMNGNGSKVELDGTKEQQSGEKQGITKKSN